MDPKHRVYYYVHLGWWPSYEKNLDRVQYAVPHIKMRFLPYTPWRDKWHMTVSCFKRHEDDLVEALSKLRGVKYEKREE